MSLSTHVKSISTLKAKAAELIQEARSSGEPFVITQNGEAKAVLQDIASYEQTQETLALLKLLALGERQRDAGHAVPAAEAFRQVRAGRRPR
jgi:prevent-host-death family protein